MQQQEYHPGWSERVLAFQRTGEGRRALMEELGTYAYRYPRRKMPGLDEDAGGEFYLFCHAKLEQIVVRFRDCGKPFERYLNSVLSWQLRSFLAKRRQAEHAWQTTLRSPLWDDPDAAAETPATDVRGAAPANVTPFPSPPAPPAPPAAAPKGAKRAAVARRRILYGVLKTGHRLDQRQLAAAAQATGCELPRLRSLIEHLRRGRAGAYQRLELQRSRRNHAFARLQLWSGAAHRETDGKFRAQAAARAARCRRSVEAAQSELARVRVAPTNRAIAAVLGIPKGTVDTGLYWLRRQRTADYAWADGAGAGERQSA